jgi:hypothetical protein
MHRKPFLSGLKGMLAFDLASGLLMWAVPTDGVLAGIAWLPVPVMLGIAAVELVSWAAGKTL